MYVYDINACCSFRILSFSIPKNLYLLSANGPATLTESLLCAATSQLNALDQFAAIVACPVYEMLCRQSFVWAHYCWHSSPFAWKVISTGKWTWAKHVCSSPLSAHSFFVVVSTCQWCCTCFVFVHIKQPFE